MTGLATTGLTVRFGGRAVLDRVDIACAPGKVTALLGPNGAGKSTLLACLAGLREPDEGIATLDGTGVLALDRRERGRRIGLLPQTPDVHWDVDVATLVELGRFPHRAGWGRSPADISAVEHAIAATDIAALRDRVVNTLSGGERSRVLLARVLAGEPAWLLADEPLASLDPAHQLDVLAVLKSAASAGAGVVVVLHDLNHALHVADDVVLLRDGRVVAAGAVDAVLTEARIAETYGVATEIGTARDGSRFVVTLGRIG
ncbi:ABC transporter ATP-binding protein [Glacieibacterium megasporae]|uniref:ABC transporter ATP-binding protein n=1 Tax=Glacieibacterium megasporae TaxID=2835787 RepID=UPI001C1DF10C|nr:ABC transporter ATP-binding protein [Polymorphobacter megasporae]UAJ11170.1 ABC transporter ATP-binding protein [Polymorphobacter megasporae]